MPTEPAESSLRIAVVGLLALLAAAGVLPVVMMYAFWVDLDGYGDPELTVPLLGFVQGGAAALFAWAVLRRRVVLPFYTVWATTCLVLVATLLTRPPGELVRDGFFILGGTFVAVITVVGFWIVHARGPTA